MTPRTTLLLSLALLSACRPSSRPAGASASATPSASPTPTPILADDDATITTFALPDSLFCGETRTVSVTVHNAGSATWTRDGNYKLGAVDDSDPFFPGETRVWLPETAVVAPGSDYVFSFDLHAPADPGNYPTDWRMVHEGVQWFGATASKTVAVACALPINATTLQKKVLFGYQGWFACEGDGGPVGGWVHWFRDNTPDAAHATVDFLPDMTDVPLEERCTTSMTKADGSPVQLYSAWHAPTVDRHFAWMEQYGIDGVLLQRFASELHDPRFLAMRDQVTRNVRAGAEAHGRVFAVEYDISGMNPATLVADIESDWMHLVDDLTLTASDRYLTDGGKPVLALWGFGFPDRPGTPEQARALIRWLRTDAPAKYRATLVGGVPWWWRDDANSQWADVYRSWDVITPWTVGAWNDEAGADGYKTTRLVPDQADAALHGRRFMPTIWPGFSWKNLNGGASNAIPRRAGRFFWRGAYDALSAGSTTIFVAMFDEVDEGTAMMKIAPASALPVPGTFVGIDADGEALPSDFYLRLGGSTSKAMRGEIPLTPNVPQ